MDRAVEAVFPEGQGRLPECQVQAVVQEAWAWAAVKARVGTPFRRSILAMMCSSNSDPPVEEVRAECRPVCHLEHRADLVTAAVAGGISLVSRQALWAPAVAGWEDPVWAAVAAAVLPQRAAVRLKP